MDHSSICEVVRTLTVSITCGFLPDLFLIPVDFVEPHIAASTVESFPNPLPSTQQVVEIFLNYVKRQCGIVFCDAQEETMPPRIRVEL